MPYSTREGELLHTRFVFFAFFSLALWQLRRTKWMLCIVGSGVLAAVLFVCMAPLYTDIAMTAGLQDAIGATTDTSSLVITGQDVDPSLESITQLSSAFDTYTMQDLQPYLDKTKEHITVETGLLSDYHSPPSPGSAASTDQISLEGNDIAQIAQGKHVSLLRGRLPRVLSQLDKRPPSMIEVALTQDSAAGLKVDINSIIYTQIMLENTHTGKPTYASLPLKVVGIVQNQGSPDLATSDPFWHENNLAPINLNPSFPTRPPWEYKLLVDNQTLLATFEQYIPIYDRTASFAFEPYFEDHHFKFPTVTLAKALNLNWYYAFDPDSISNDQLTTLISTLQTLDTQPALAASDVLIYGLNDMHFTVPIDALTNYQSQLAAAQTPAFGLVLVIFCLLVYFVALMAGLLVERQASALAIVNSRGASRRQIFGALMIQGFGICLIALLLGPILALPAAAGLAWIWLARNDDAAITTVWHAGWQTIFSVSDYALITVLVVLCVLIVAMNQAVSSSMLTVRSETGRTTRRPLWQRLHVDLVAIVVMVIVYGVSLYLANVGVLNPQLQALLFAPLVLLRAFLIIIVSLLLFLRLVPLILRGGSWWVARRSQGVPAMIALAQLSRSPRQLLRLSVLLSLTTAFALFALVFSASQVQRVQDIAIQTVGSDFTGTLTDLPDVDTMPAQVKLYSQVPGVKSVSVGYRGNMWITDQGIGVDFLAVDPVTYGRTALLPTDDKMQAPLSSLMQQLGQSNVQVRGQQVVPAIVDESLWEIDHLKLGSVFALQINNSGSYSSIYCKAIARIDSLPMESAPNSVLVDIHTYQRAYDQVINTQGDQPLHLNQIWMRTSSDPAILARTRSELNSADYSLLAVMDRFQLAVTLSREPLYLQIIGLLFIGPWIALFLVLSGSFLSSWMYIRDRLVNFALLRALGATPGHIARTLAWEQAITYTLALIMGIIFGVFLSLTVVPSLIFTSAWGRQVTIEDFYQLQNIPPVQLTFPVLVGVGLLILIAICMLVLGMMIRVVSRPSMSAVLRLNED